jgi:hypothetical protein
MAVEVRVRGVQLQLQTGAMDFRGPVSMEVCGKV